MSALGEAGFAFLAGVLTFFSPCSYALFPGYVGYYVAAVDGDRPPLSGVASRGTAASLGALCTFVVLGAVAFWATEAFESVLPVIEPTVGVVLVAFGLLVVWKGAVSFTVPLPARRSSVVGFGLFGAVYALAATACVLPLFLTIATTSVGLSVAGTALVLGAYASAFSLLMLAATVAVAVGRSTLVGQFAGYAPQLTRAAGVVIVLAGLGQLYIAFQVAPLEPLMV